MRPGGSLVLLLTVGTLGCTDRAVEPVHAPAGEPLPGLAPAGLSRFHQGRALFERPFAPHEGLGPLFNQTRCSSCHDLPTTGGHGAEPVTKVSRYDAASGCDLLEAEGGDLLQSSVTEAARALGLAPEVIPGRATAVTELRAPPLYGLGLVEAVDDAAIVARADPDDRDGDGISGRIAPAVDGAVGRFGAKGRHATLLGFIEGAARGELGLTTPGSPEENQRNGLPLPEGADTVPDPELDAAALELLASYVRYLAPVHTELTPTRGPDENVEAGRRAFERIGCAACHVPTHTTGAASEPALSHVPFSAYSDYLLHDLGADLADVCAPGVVPAEWMTARLAGLGMRDEFLHNRRAQSIEAAIAAHGAEGAASRDAYGALSEEDRARLLRFLASL